MFASFLKCHTWVIFENLFAILRPPSRSYTEKVVFSKNLYTLTMLGCFNPNLGPIWTNPIVGLKFNVNPTFGFVHI